ncbi:MAG: FtsX-like permease family protein [Rhodobacter sp.]|nr:FtsX-like permease family protein [Rhodobacter sp.]
MWIAGLSALLSHWRRKPLQLATLVLGLALATALWSGVQAINSEARASYADASAALGETRYAQLLPREGEIPLARYVALRRAGGQVSPVVEGRMTLAGESWRLIGIDPLTVPGDVAPSGANIAGDLAGFLTGGGRVYAPPEATGALAQALDIPVLPADGIAPGVLFTDIGVAQRLLGLDGGISRLILRDDQPLGLPEVATLAPDLDLRRPEQGSDVARLTDSFHLNLTAFGLLSFAVGLFIVHGAIGLAFEQRRPMFRTLRALGLPMRTLVILVCLELLLFALIAGAIGMVLGYAIAAALLPDVAATLRGLYGAEVDGSLSLRPAWWLAGTAIAIGGTALAAAGAVWRVGRLPILAAAQPRAWARASERRLYVLGGGAAILALVSLTAGLFGSGLVAGFVLLGALLIAAALALPVLLHAFLTVATRKARGPLAEWFWADTRQQLPGLSLALMALLLALSANIGVGTMVASFRLTFTGWLDQRLASELYVTAETEAQAPALRAFLEPRADAVLPIWNIDGRVAGLPAEIYGVADHPTYRDSWPMLESLPDVWDLVAQGEAVLINEQLARREGIGPGDPLSLPGAWEAQIGGVYSDYGNPVGQVLVGLPHLVARFPDIEKRRFGVRIAPERTADLARALRDEFGLPAQNMIDQASLKAFSLQIFERTFTVTAALNVLTLSVAGFAILTSLLTLAAVRQPQLAPVWALGLTRRRLAALELARALLLAALTILAAIPVGLLLSWTLLAVINVEAFGWRLPMFLFPRDWLVLGLLSLMAAALAALWPARKLARTPPAELLKIFVNER